MCSSCFCWWGGGGPWSYRTQEQEITETLNLLAVAFAPSVEAALWDYQLGVLNTMASGIGEHPAVARVIIKGSLQKTEKIVR